jgi:hypothetical protein
MSETNITYPSFEEFKNTLSNNNINVSNFAEIEEAFPKLFNVTYKDYLHQRYMIDNYSLKELADNTGIKRGTVPYHLKKYGIKKDREDAKKPDSQFKTISQIEKETGQVFYDYYNSFVEQGLSQTEIVIKLNLCSSSTVASYLYRYKADQERKGKKSEVKSVLDDREISFRLNNLIKYFPELFNMEYEEYLKEKYINEKMGLYDLSLLMGTNTDTLTRHLKHFNLNKTLSEARRDAIESGKINYDMILSKARKTMKKSNYNSHTQGYAHSLIQEKLTESLITDKNDHIEIITSLNEWSILKDKEVDIPVIIIDNSTNTYKKYSIEFQGSYHHSVDKMKQSDQEKESRLTNQGWKHFLLDYDESYSKINEGIDTIINEIKKDFIYKAI